jgi:glucose/arabinose dehydrogenase
MKLAAFLLIACATACAAAEIFTSSAHRFRIETVADGLEHPWAVAKLPDGDFLVTERAGRVLRIGKDGTKTPVDGVPEVVVKGQGGLLDLALHPQYEENGWIYLAYAKPLPGGSMTAVARARLKDDRLVDLEIIFDPPADQASNTGLHFGCRIVFDGRGHVFFSIGDRGGPTNPENLAQSLASVTGKIHRLHDDGRVPSDNPFVGQKGVMPSIWAYGSRNAQGLVYDTATDRLWETEHGPRGGDELNNIRKGANYGWPLATYGINYSGTTISKNKSLAGMEDPVVQWTPVIAASGLALYRGDKFPRWRGNLFTGGLASEKLVRLELNGAAVTEQEIVLQDTGRIRDVRAFDDGFLYLVYDEPGKVVRLVPTD